MSLSTDHYISIKNGLFDTTSRTDLRSLFGNLKTHPNKDLIVVYLHGGLVTQNAAKSVAEKTLFDRYSEAGAYPIFFFWQTGPLDVVTGNLKEIFDEKVFQRLLSRITQFAVAKLGQRPDTRGETLELDDPQVIEAELTQPAGLEPYAQWSAEDLPPDAELLTTEALQFQQELERDFTLRNEAEKIANSLATEEEIAADEQERGATIRASTHTLMSPSVLQGIRDEATAAGTAGDTRGPIASVALKRLIGGAVKILTRVIKRFASRRDHGVYVTIVEELLHEFYLASVGELGWRLMKNDARDAFKPDPNQYGGTAFLEELRDHCEAGNKPRVLLIGHSAGSVFICHLLQAAQRMPLPEDIKFDVVFLAPACTFSLLSETLEVAKGRISNIRMFSMRDTLEIRDQMLGPLFPRSILYFVSGLLEDERDKPLVGMERFFDPNPPFDARSYQDVEDGRLLFKDATRTVWSEEDLGPGRRSKAKGHGEFDDQDKITGKSLQHIVREGFE